MDIIETAKDAVTGMLEILMIATNANEDAARRLSNIRDTSLSKAEKLADVEILIKDGEKIEDCKKAIDENPIFDRLRKIYVSDENYAHLSGLELINVGMGLKNLIICS